MGIIVGIDLGTSTSEIAILKNGKPEVIPNLDGEFITPSVVGVSDEGNIIVGKAARDQLLLKPNDTIIEVKRLMGTSSKLAIGGEEYSPQEISSFIISYLIESAQKFIGEDVDRAVITVPAYFSDEQRRATIEAGKLAGIKVERIINEPTAASLDYGIEHMEDCKNILVYDLGGGTLDVTVLEMFEGVMDVKASSGNNKLGGKDFDQSIMDYLMEYFHSLYQKDISDDNRAMMRLKDEAEKCKIELSKSSSYQVSLPFFAEYNGNPVSLEKEITKELFEELIKEKVESTKKQIDIALNDSGLNKSDIDLILLVGGSTRIPYVKNFIERALDKSPEAVVDPDLAVVRGASIQAGIINEDLSSDKDIMITDVCPYTLGTSILDFIGGIPDHDVFDVIIPRNITIPATKEKIYYTVADNQEEVEITVYQGDFKKASMNNLLGKFTLENIPPAPASEQKIKISFSYDVNGILQVEGTIVKTGENAKITIDTSKSDIAEEINTDGWEDVQNARKFRAVINKASRIIENNEAGIFHTEIESLIKKLKIGLVEGVDIEELNMIKNEVTDILYELSSEDGI